MKITAEAYGLKIGVDNSVTAALIDGKWGIRLSFLSANYDSKFDVVLTEEEAKNLQQNIQQSIVQIVEVKKQQAGQSK